VKNAFTPILGNRRSTGTAGHGNSSGSFGGRNASAVNGEGESYVRRHAKASSAGSASSRGKGLIRISGASACILALLVFAGVGASPAGAAVPAKGVNGFFYGAGIFGGQLNTPRGVAVNQSNGNVYVVDSSNNRVVAFDSNGKFLRAWGQDVVSAGPGNNGTGYEICVPANGDSCKEGVSGSTGGSMSSPQGIAVNQSTGDLYVTDQSNRRIQQFDANGSFIRAFGQDVVESGPGNSAPASAVQTLIVTATSGKYTLKFQGKETAELAFNATAAQIQSALTALTSIGASNATVSETSPGVFKVSFSGGLANNPQPLIATESGPGEPLGGGSATVANTTTGATGYEICVAANGDVCKSGFASNTVTTTGGAFGTAMGQPAVAPLGSPNAGNLLVPDATNLRVQEFSSSGAFIRAFGFDVAKAGPGNGGANEQQTVTVPGTVSAGTFKLSLVTGNGFGTTTSGSNVVTGVNAATGAFLVGDEITGSGIPAATTISAVGPGTLTLSANATSSGARALTATETTAAINWNAPATGAGSLQEKLAALAAIGIGNVTVGGGPGATSPFSVTFSGGIMAHSDIAQMTVTNSLTGGSATVATALNGGGFEVCSASSFDACKVGVTGSTAGQFAASTPTRIAEDSAGNIYTVEPTTNFRVQKFTLPGNVVTPQGTFDEADLKGTAASSAPTDVAVNPATNNVLVSKAFVAGSTPSCPITGVASVAESRVVEVSAAGALEGTHDVCAGITPVNGLAIRGSSGNVYVSSTFGGSRIYVLNTGQPAVPSVSITNVSDIGAHGATLNALINPGGPELPYGQETTYKLEYKRSSDVSFSSLFNLEGSAGNRTTSKALTLSLDGLQAGTSYDVRLVANKPFGSGSSSQTVSFATKASAPDVTLPDFVTLNETEARLAGTVNPNNQTTGYRFEYVSQAGFEASGFAGATHVPASDVAVGSGTAPVSAAQLVTGLAPGATYHYRLLAGNPSGQSTASGTFTTQNLNDCPNASLRAGQASAANPAGSAYLPSCMALEMVSPPNKFNEKADTPQLSPNGETVVFASLGALGGTNQVGNGLGGDPYVARRGPSGWTTYATEPPATSSLFAYPCSYDVSFSRWTSLLRPSQETTIPSASSLGGSFAPLGPTLTKQQTGVVLSCEGGSADAQHIFFAGSLGGFLPGDPVSDDVSQGGNQYEAYRDANGSPTVELITRDKDGKVWGGACGSQIGANITNPLGTAKRAAISPDASRVYFSARPSQGAGTCNRTANKLRVMERLRTPAGPVISQVSTSECTRVAPPCDTSNGDDIYRAASYEGDKVFFTTTRQLANSDLDTGTQCSSSGVSGGCDLYLYDASAAPGARLTQISAGDASAPTPGKGAEVLGVVDVAGDGSHAYFVARGVLTTAPNARGAVAEAGKPNLYLYQRDGAHPGGSTAFIAVLGTSDGNTWGAGPGFNRAAAVPLLGSDVEDLSVGGDGHVLVFQSAAPLTPDDTDTRIDIYRYDSESGALERISKAAPGGADNGPFDAEGLGPSYIAFQFPVSPGDLTSGRAVSEDGKTIVFYTEEALDPNDTDGQPTSYVWHAGSVTAIQQSLAPDESALGNPLRPTVSMSGEEVAFVANARLLPEDGDNARDVYVLRADGGYPPVTPPAPCGGEACQGNPAPQPGDRGAASESFVGPGNTPVPPSRCKKGSVRKKGKCVKKPARKRATHKKTRKRNANADRRAGK
jgi:hypothetical protein